MTERSMRWVLGGVLTAVLAGGCSKDEAEDPRVEAERVKEVPVPEPEPEPVPEPVTRPGTCMDVYKTEPVADGNAELKMSVGGASIGLELDPAARYAKSAIWGAGDAPASCGALRPGPSKDDGRLLWVVQLHREGQPALRLQVLGAKGGESSMKEANLTALYRPGSKDEAASLVFEKGLVKVSPAPPAAGKVELEIVGAAGTFGNPPVPFKLSGKLTGTFGPPAPEPRSGVTR